MTPNNNDTLPIINKKYAQIGLNFPEIRVVALLIGKANEIQLSKIREITEKRSIQLKMRILREERV